jgi:hypothetical protein
VARGASLKILTTNLTNLTNKGGASAEAFVWFVRFVVHEFAGHRLVAGRLAWVPAFAGMSGMLGW